MGRVCERGSLKVQMKRGRVDDGVVWCLCMLNVMSILVKCDV